MNDQLLLGIAGLWVALFSIYANTLARLYVANKQRQLGVIGAIGGMFLVAFLVVLAFLLGGGKVVVLLILGLLITIPVIGFRTIRTRTMEPPTRDLSKRFLLAFIAVLIPAGVVFFLYSLFPTERGRILGTRIVPVSPLTVAHLYSFEPGEEDVWEAQGEKVSIARSSSLVHSGSHSLEIKLDVGPYEPGEHHGIRVSPAPFGIAKAIVAYLYLPTSAQTEDHQLMAFLMAQGNDGRSHFSHYVFLRAGAWTPLFWGTEYGYWDELACTDADQDGSCDDTGGYWREWDGSLIALEIVVGSMDRPYLGSIYVDDITIFAVTFPP